jgi:L,D-transpeptidase ErfK/SrfK
LKLAHMDADEMKRLVAIRTVALLFVFVSSYANAQEFPPVAHLIVGSHSEYVVKRGDSLVSIGARKGVESETLAAMNGLKPKVALRPGQVLNIDNRHIVPADLNEGILINLPQRKLFLLRGGQVESSYPIGPGKAAFGTPIGEFSVVQMRANPTWYVPKSIQDEWARAGKVVKKAVPPGPQNPLGGYWIGLSFSSYGIHGTNKPLSIYDFQSRGCVRMHPEDAGALFQQVKVGEPGEIIYEPLLLAKLEDGRIFVEAHQDPYGKNKSDPLQFLHKVSAANNLDKVIDWKRAADVISNNEGVARQVDVISH